MSNKCLRIFMCLAVVCFVAAGAAAQSEPALISEAGVGGKADFPGPSGPNIVLYDQTSNGSGNGAPDQEFEAAFAAYSSEGADDFEVTFPSGWDVNEVAVIGTQTIAGVPAAINVNFYPDNGGVPDATAVCSYPGLTSFVGNESITTTLPAPCSLAPGFYWMAHQTVQDFGTAGQHFWSNVGTANTLNSPGVWRNPGDGFASGCTTFTQQSVCGVGGGASDDFLFQIIGVEGATGVPALPWAGLAALLAILLGISYVMLRRRTV